MKDALSESAIVRAVAEEAGRRLTRAVIKALQEREETLSGDDSGLATVWDEICVQVQYEQSFYWDAYDDTARSFIRSRVAELPKHERDALWLQTDSAAVWEVEEPKVMDLYQVCDDDIVEYLTRKYLYVEAGRWSNPRIRAFIDHAAIRD